VEADNILGHSYYKALDACINRAVEGLRVCEDVLRFVLKEPDSVILKKIRHEIVEISGCFPRNLLLGERNVNTDSQKFIDLKSEGTRSSVSDIFTANLHRAVEAVRSLEEFSKISEPDASGRFQKLRFDLYDFEKKAFILFHRKKIREKFTCSLYSILDSSFIKNNEYADAAERLIQGGSSIIQLRMKNVSPARELEVARQISDICRKKRVLFIVNDHPDIALLSGADGVHLGQDDISPEDARQILPEHMIIGVSTHSSEQVKSACAQKPDYIAVGPVFDTVSKTGDLIKGIGADIFTNSALSDEVLFVGIGGLNPDRIRTLDKRFCSCFAMISVLYKDNLIEENCRAVLSAIRE